jgi:hypothetical protein
MATYYSSETRQRGDGTPRPVGNAALNQRERVFRATIPLDVPPLSASSTGTVIASGDIISCFRVPAGTRWLSGTLNTSVSLGTATIAVGVAGTPGKYRAAAVLTAVDTPTAFATALAQAAGELQADEEIIITVTTANLPNTAGARLILDMRYAAP